MQNVQDIDAVLHRETRLGWIDSDRHHRIRVPGAHAVPEPYFGAKIPEVVTRDSTVHQIRLIAAAPLASQSYYLNCRTGFSGGCSKPKLPIPSFTVPKSKIPTRAKDLGERAWLSLFAPHCCSASKPSDILVRWDDIEPAVKLADVDTTRTTKTVVTMTTFVGTPVYMAPEIWRHEGPPGKPTDMWTIGLVALQLFTTWRPEQDKSWVYGEHGIAHNMLGHDIWIRKVLMRHVATAPSYIQPLLEALIREAPKVRWTADDALDWVEENAKSHKRPKRKRDTSAGRLSAAPWADLGH